MWIAIFTLIVVMIWLVVFKEIKDGGHGGIFNLLLFLTTLLLMIALGQEVFFN